MTFGGPGAEKKPRVTNPLGGEEEPFGLGFGTEDDECHHPAWNMEGSRILCHRNNSEPYGHYSMRTLYEFQPDASGERWVRSTTAAGTDGRLFDPIEPGELEALFPGMRTSDCRLYFYKYAEWCGSDDYVLATLYCSDGTGRDGRIYSSRVIVVKLRGEDGRPVYSDVTSAVEAAFAGGAVWRGIFGTCSRRRALNSWAPALP